MKPVNIYLEIGTKRVFAGAIDWPGWARSGRDEESAQQALIDYGPRYREVLERVGIAFSPPGDRNDVAVVERLKGTATTDFGAPDVAPEADSRPIDDGEMERMKALLRASWQALDAAVQAAKGKALRQGPRGGGRDLEKLIRHVQGADRGYLSRLDWKLPKDNQDLDVETAQIREEVIAALDRVARGELPERGPRGGTIWKPRYYLRRAIWHTLDHAWELEDRTL